MSKRVAVYARVSTSRQEQADLSIPDQVREARNYCAKKGWVIVKEYCEHGSARDDNRLNFQRLISDACVDPSPFDIVLVHSLSRFSRDSIDQGLYERRLEKHGVLLKSITQAFGDGDEGRLVRRILAAADEHTSAETAKHTRRAMAENARQGFWNGAVPPLGYTTEIAEYRGKKAKKRLVIAPKEAAIVKLIFTLFLEGDGQSGPMGVKQITKYLNKRGYTTKRGGAFYTSTVHGILSRSTYAGTHYYNRTDSRTRKEKPREKWIAIETPVIIEPSFFETVQRRLNERRPDKTAPRTTNSPVLLSGLGRCQNCGSTLSLTTGKSGKYRYYSCSAKNLKGTCEKPARIPESRLDDIVIDALLSRITTPGHLKELLKEVRETNRARQTETMDQLKALRQEKRQIECKVDRLYSALMAGTITDNANFRRQLKKLERRQDEVIRLIGNTERQSLLSTSRITDKHIERFAKAIEQELRNGAPPFRKQMTNLFVSEITVGKEEIRIKGSKQALAAAVDASRKGKAKVPGFVREWRPLRDSNPCFRRERAVS